MGVELLLSISVIILAIVGAIGWQQVLAGKVMVSSAGFRSRRWTLLAFIVMPVLGLLVYVHYFLTMTPSHSVLVGFLFIFSLIFLSWYERLQARVRRLLIDYSIRTILFMAAAFAVIVTFSIALTLIFESLRFFQHVAFLDFILGLRWSPSAGYFGAVPLFIGTLLITSISMVIAVPAGLMSAVYLSHYAHPKTRNFVKPLLELLAGIPTVVYGFLALVAISPILQGVGSFIGLPIAAESALGVGLVMGFMIIPYIASLSDDILTAVPKSMADGSLALGATKSETIKKVILPSAFPGVMASFLLAISRAIGETMIVVMAAGYSARLTVNPLEAVTTMTVQIVSLLTGDQEFSSPNTLSAFALGLVLLLITLGLNIIAARVIRHYREKYEPAG